MEELEYYENYEAALVQELLKVCNSAGMLDDTLLASDDIDEKWADYANDYMADAIEQINGYPEVAIAWAGFMGMAVAKWWDTDWRRVSRNEYKSLYGSQGFDNMDDHIVEDILDSGKTLGGDYCSWNVWNSHSFAGTMFSNFNKSMNPLIGINSNGVFNYGKFWAIEDKIVWAEKVDADAASSSNAAHNKAILLYVTEATEPQINEETKEFEVFYPAYLVIDGRTHLVNLNPTYAVNKFSGEVGKAKIMQAQKDIEKDKSF